MEEHKLSWALGWASQPKTSFVHGEWTQPQGAILDSINPANGKVIASLSEATTDQIDRAVDSGLNAFADWKKIGRKQRAGILNQIAAVIRKHRSELATLESLDNGKLYRESYEDDLPEAAEVFEYYAGWTNKFYGETAPVEGEFINYTVREPLGVCALMVPWNFPLLLAAWKMAPALAMGNTVLLKPSPFTSLSSLRLVELLHQEKVLAPGVVNVVLGGAVVGEALSAHARIAKVSFTGSTVVGKLVASQAVQSNLKSVSLELGGKSPNIVFADAPDIDFAIERSFTAMFSHKGEKCSEPTRLFVHESLYPRFEKRLAELAEKVVCGDPFDPKSDQGPQCHEAHYRKILSYIDAGKAEGAKLLAGGTADSKVGSGQGFFIRPTLFGNVGPKMRIAQEEIFGPVLCMTPFRSEDEVVEMANDTIYGLAAGLWTRDVSTAHRVAGRLDAGQVFVNKYGCYDFASPFGGFKQSGWGKEMAVHSLESYTKLKSVWVKL